MKYNLVEFLSRYTDNPESCKLFAVLEELPPIGKEGPWVAGGAVRRTLQLKALESDIDFFFRDEEQMLSFKAAIEMMKPLKKHENDKNTTYEVVVDDDVMQIQLIHFQFYDTADSVIDSFDFTITQFLYDGEHLVCGDYSLWDLSRKKLALHKLTFGVSTVRRLIKYSNQGFTACAGTLTDILNKVVENPNLINSDIQYID